MIDALAANSTFSIFNSASKNFFAAKNSLPFQMQKIPLDKPYKDLDFSSEVYRYSAFLFVHENKNKNIKIKIGLKDIALLIANLWRMVNFVLLSVYLLFL